MSTARRHHFVPASYLARFTGGKARDSRLWAVDLTETRWVRTSPGKAARRRDYYTVDVPGEVGDLIEQRVLAPIEGAANDLIGNIVSARRLPSGRDFALLMHYVALLALRVPAWRETYTPAMRQIAEWMMANTLRSPEVWEAQVAAMRADGIEIGPAPYEEMKGFIEGKEYSIDIANEFHSPMRVLVIGLGAFGFSLARTLKEMGHEVIVVERDEALVDRHAEWVTRAVAGDATDPALLERVGADADAAVIATGEDLSTTILVTMALRDLGVKEIYAKARSVNAVRALDRVGVTEAVFPERDAGVRLAHSIISREVLDYTPLGEGFSMQEITVPESWTGRSLVELGPRERMGLQVVAVRDALTGELSLPPDPAARLKPSDSLLVAGRDEELEKLSPGDG